MENRILHIHPKEVKNWRKILDNEGLNRRISVYESPYRRRVVLKERKSTPYALTECGLAVLQVLGITLSSSEKYLYIVTLSQTIKNEKRRVEFGVNYPKLYYIDKKILIEEWVKGETLYEYLNTCDSDSVKRIAESIGKELATVHKRGYFFGDLKASNIIVTPDEKIYHTDFERCGRIVGPNGKFLRDQDLATMLGSMYPLRPSTLRTFRDELYSSYISGGEEIDDKTQTLVNCCGLLIHRKLVPNVIRNVFGAIANPYSA